MLAPICKHVNISHQCIPRHAGSLAIVWLMIRQDTKDNCIQVTAQQHNFIGNNYNVPDRLHHSTTYPFNSSVSTLCRLKKEVALNRKSRLKDLASIKRAVNRWLGSQHSVSKSHWLRSFSYLHYSKMGET